MCTVHKLSHTVATSDRAPDGLIELVSLDKITSELILLCKIHHNFTILDFYISQSSDCSNICKVWCET